MYILWSLDAHQKRIKTAKYQAKTVRLDKMSRRDEVSQDKKFTFGQNVQTGRGENVNDMKTEMLRVRMTPEEKAALHRRASLHRKSMSEYIRSVAKCPPDVTRDEFDASIVRMIYEINKIGVNINQIAKKYNEHQYVEPSADLLDKLDEVYAMMKSTIQIMKGGKDVTDY